MRVVIGGGVIVIADKHHNNIEERCVFIRKWYSKNTEHDTAVLVAVQRKQFPGIFFSHHTNLVYIISAKYNCVLCMYYEMCFDYELRFFFSK